MGILLNFPILTSYHLPVGQLIFFVLISLCVSDCDVLYVSIVVLVVYRQLLEDNFFFCHSTRAFRNFSSAVQQFNFIPSNFFLSRSAAHGSHFKRLSHPFVIRSVAMRFTVQMDIHFYGFCVRGHICATLCPLSKHSNFFLETQSL